MLPHILENYMIPQIFYLIPQAPGHLLTVVLLAQSAIAPATLIQNK